MATLDDNGKMFAPSLAGADANLVTRAPSKSMRVLPTTILLYDSCSLVTVPNLATFRLVPLATKEVMSLPWELQV